MLTKEGEGRRIITASIRQDNIDEVLGEFACWHSHEKKRYISNKPMNNAR